MKKGGKRRMFYWVGLGVVMVAAGFFRFYRLDEIPAEIFGDIVENLKHIENAVEGETGALWGYDGRETMLFGLMIPLAKWLGISYLNLKTGVAIVGLLTVVAVFGLAKIVGGWRLGLMTAFLMAVSKWPVIYSRIGFRNGLTPLFVCLTYYFLIKIYKNKIKSIDLTATGLFLGLGLYTYTAFRAVVISVFVSVIVLLFRKQKIKWSKKVKYFGVVLASFLMVASPMIVDYIKRPDIYMTHPGPMLFNEEKKLRFDWKGVLMKNVVNNNLMFFKRGDVVFRVNLSSPHFFRQ